MIKEIAVDPVSRVEGHGKIRLVQDNDGRIADVFFAVQEFRGFEKFCEGAFVERLPLVTSRICGICPISHHLASVKAIEDCYQTKVSSTVVKLRELMALGQVIESHMLSVAVLSLPDLLPECQEPLKRNIIGLFNANNAIVNRVLELRSFGTALCRTVGRRPGHPIGSRIGGVVTPLRVEEKEELLKTCAKAEPHVLWFAQTLHSVADQNTESIDQLGDIRTAYMGMSQNNTLAFYEGDVQVIKDDGDTMASFATNEYFKHVEEKVENWSYMKFPVLKSGERFRVGPLARINIANDIFQSLAHDELFWFRDRWGSPAHKTLCYHFARYIEVIYAYERARELLNDPDITKVDAFCQPVMKAGTGVGVVEAPRGTLVHRYEIDNEGRACKVDLFVATQHNNFGFNDALKETATKNITNGDPDETTLNKLEMIVRAYDPCLSCATHTLNGRSFKFELTDQEGKIVKEW